MNFKIISKTLGKYLFYFSFTLIVPLCVALYYEFVTPEKYLKNYDALEFFQTFLITLLLSFLLQFIGRNAKGYLRKKESILIVVMIWIVTAFIGALPFYLTNTLENPFDAYFESMSGLTTTGSTVMHPKAYDQAGMEIPNQIKVREDYGDKIYSFYGTITPIRDKDGKIIFSGIEAVSNSLLFWRSFLQWLGGMGIVVLFLAVLPALTAGGKFLYQMEVPGHSKDTLVPRIKETSSILWKIYLAFTIIQIYLLIWTNPHLPLFDAFCITFSTLSTGGFSVKNLSIGAYNNVHTEWIVIVFMLIGSCNFAIFFQIIRKQLYRLYEPDFLFFLLVTFFGALLIVLGIYGTAEFLLDGSQSTYTLSKSIREGIFQAVSAQTTTGFSTVDFDHWNFSPKLIMLILMFIGGMTGSTSGGIKTSRIYILIKIVIHKIRSMYHPEMVKKLMIGKQEIDEKNAITVLVFFAIVIFFAILGTVFLVFDNVDFESSISIIASCLNNIGLSYKAAGPTESFAFLSDFNKFMSALWMLLGRLEYFAVLLLFLPSFWKKD